MLHPGRLQPFKSLEKTGSKQQPDDQKSLPSGIRPRSEVQDFRVVVKAGYVCLTIKIWPQ